MPDLSVHELNSFLFLVDCLSITIIYAPITTNTLSECLYKNTHLINYLYKIYNTDNSITLDELSEAQIDILTQVIENYFFYKALFLPYRNLTLSEIILTLHRQDLTLALEIILNCYREFYFNLKQSTAI